MKVLFISHDANRTGATIVLKHHLNALRKNGLIDFDIAFLKGGVLENEFSKIANIFFLKKPELSFLKRGLKKIKLISNAPYQSLNTTKYNIVYGNTAVTCEYLNFVKQKNESCVTICHVHEMDYSIKYYIGKQKFTNAAKRIDLFVAASLQVKDNLVQNYGIRKEKIIIHYEYIPIQNQILTNSTLHHNKLKICGCGTVDWRKGIDVFIRAAYQLKKRVNPDAFHFYWLGANKSTLDYERALFDIEKLGISDQISLIENIPAPLEIIKDCNLFFLSSREDPFPLVCLEAASAGLPIVCFEGSGGMTEFVNSSNGWTIPYLDTDVFADLCINLMQSTNNELYVKGRKAAEDVKNFDIEIGAKKLEQILLQYKKH